MSDENKVIRFPNWPAIKPTRHEKVDEHLNYEKRWWSHEWIVFRDTFAVNALNQRRLLKRETLGVFDTEAEATNRFEELRRIEAIMYGAHVASGRQEYLDRLQRIVDGEDEETVERLESERSEQFPDDEPPGAA
ncbi:hypothetical protein LMIY3S_04764 [Labrys miyagiensis]